jgi:hypothetical protein
MCNAKALKKMGIFTKDLNNNTIFEWVFNYKKVNYDWIDPTAKIIKKISDYAKS